MNLNTANATQITSFIKKFLDEKELDRSDFIVEHDLYGKTDMPFSVVVDGLTTTEQNINFLRGVALAISTLDFKNAPKSVFRKLFQDVADKMITFV